MDRKNRTLKYAETPAILTQARVKQGQVYYKRETQLIHKNTGSWDDVIMRFDNYIHYE